MPRRILIFVNGILTWPGNSRDWNSRAVTWVHSSLGLCHGTRVIDLDCRAEKVEYFCGPIGRALGQRKRAAKVIELLDAYLGWDIILVGHSNGAAVILDALQTAGWPRIDSLHLVSAACEAHFDANGLNAALLRDRVKKVCVYCGGCDRALHIAHSLIGRFLGYGVLGLHGPMGVDPDVTDRVGTVTWPNFGHSDCWHPANFNRTMAHFVN